MRVSAINPSSVLLKGCCKLMLMAEERKRKRKGEKNEQAFMQGK
jgi:hypothetical protein